MRAVTVTHEAGAAPQAIGREHGPARRRARWRHARTPLMLALFAFFAYASGLRWGLPHATGPDRVDSWGVDDETPLGPLAEIHNIMEPKPDRNLGYPLMYSFMAAAAYAPYLGGLTATGGLSTPSGEYPYGLSDPASALRTLGIIAHLLTTLLAVGVVLAVYYAARAAWGEGAGALAGLFVMTATPMFYYARTGNVDVPMLFFACLAFAAYAKIVCDGHSLRRALALGVFVGFALGTKEAALGIFLVMPFVVVALHRRQHPELFVRSWVFWRPHLLALFAAVLALGVGSGFFVEPSRYIAHLQYLAGRLDALAVETAGAAVHTFPYTLQGHVDYARSMLTDLASILNVGGLTLALAGVLLAALRRQRAALLALPALSYLLYMFLTLRAAQVRYLLPAAVLLSGFAAYAVMRGWQAQSRPVRFAAAAAAGVVLGVQLLRGADLTYQMVNDARFAAAAWLRQNARPGDRLEYFGPSQKLPPLDASIVTGRATLYEGMYAPARVDDEKVREILASWQERRPRFVIALPDHGSAPGVPHSHTFPPALFAEMLDGRHGFRLAERFRTAPLFPWLPPAGLDYPTVNPLIHVFEATDAGG